jgi:hypothetical protein
LRDADVLRFFAPLLLFVLETLRASSKPKAQTLFFALKGLPEPVRRISSFKRVADTPKTSAVSLTVGNGPVIVAFIQTSQLNITSLWRYFLPPFPQDTRFFFHRPCVHEIPAPSFKPQRQHAT